MNAPVAKTWQAWTNPINIIRWNSASDDWHTTKAETMNTIELQKTGWQAILDNFKKYTESVAR